MSNRSLTIGGVVIVVVVSIAAGAWLSAPSGTSPSSHRPDPGDALSGEMQTHLLAWHGMMVGGHRAAVSSPTGAGISNVWCMGQFVCDLFVPHHAHEVVLTFGHPAELSEGATFTATKGDTQLEANETGHILLPEAGVWEIQGHPTGNAHPSWVYGVEAWIWTNDTEEALDPQPGLVDGIVGHTRIATSPATPGSWCFPTCSLERPTEGELATFSASHTRREAGNMSFQIGEGDQALEIGPGLTEVALEDLPEAETLPVTVRPAVANGDVAWYIEMQVTK